MIMNVRKGFTLVETMVVLVISAMLLSLSLLISHDFNINQYRNYLFWKEFQGDYELYESLAREHNSTILISFSSISRKVNFYSINNPKIPRKVLNEPKDLSTHRNYKISIKGDGHVDPASVIWLVNGREKYNQRFQMGWGMYTIENEMSKKTSRGDFD